MFSDGLLLICRLVKSRGMYVFFILSLLLLLLLLLSYTHNPTSYRQELDINRRRTRKTQNKIKGSLLFFLFTLASLSLSRTLSQRKILLKNHSVTPDGSVSVVLKREVEEKEETGKKKNSSCFTLLFSSAEEMNEWYTNLLKYTHNKLPTQQ